MSFTIRPAVRENTSLIIGIAGPSGGGKTYSAFALAKGLAGGERFAVIDTEAGRALHYADQFAFDHIDFAAPFSPARYVEAIDTARDYPVIIIDSASHEWAGDGGVLDMQDAEHARSSYADAKKMQSWIKPKMAHKRMMTRLLQQRAHLIFCLRAEEKTLVRKVWSKEKQRMITEVVSPADRPLHERWEPICEKSFMYEMTVSVLVLPDRPGVAVPVKVQEQHRGIVDTGRPLDVDVGAGLAAWAAGGSVVDEDFLRAAEDWASKGPAAFKSWWAALSVDERRGLPKHEVDRLIEVAKRVPDEAAS